MYIILRELIKIILRLKQSPFNDHIILIKTLSYSCGNYIIVKEQSAIELPINTHAPDGFSEKNKSWKGNKKG